MTELRQVRFFAASCVAFYVIMVWAFWTEPGAPTPPRMLEVPEAAQVADDDTRHGESVRAILSLADLVRWAIEPPAWVARHLAAAGRAWLGLPAAAEPDC